MAYPNSDGEGQVIRNGSARPLSAVQQMDQSHPNMTPQGWDAFFGVTGGTPRGDQWYAQHEELTAVLQQVLRLLEKLEEAKNTGLEPSLVSSLHSYVDVARTKQTELGVEDRVGSMLDNWAEQWKKAQPDSPLLAGLDSFWHSGGAQTVGGVVPGIGESMDLEVLLDDDADGIDKILAGLSLVVSGLTLGAAPNFGGALRNADEALDLASDAAQQGRRLTGFAYDESLSGSTTLGYTLPNGDIFIQPGLAPAIERHTRLHEGVHSFLSVADNAPFAGIRQSFGVSAYKNSAFFNASEEVLAEWIASGSLRQGIRHAFNGAYIIRKDTVVTPALFALELAIGATGFGSLGYGTFLFGEWFFGGDE